MLDTVILAQVFWRGLRNKKEVAWQEGVRTPLRVWPKDLDINIHMTNSRYLKAMDLGRWDLVLQTQALGKSLKKRWRFVVGAIQIVYLRSLEPFQSYSLWTRVAKIDHKWIYFKQSFMVGQRVFAEATVKVAVLSEAKRVPMAEISQVYGLGSEFFSTQ